MACCFRRHSTPFATRTSCENSMRPAESLTIEWGITWRVHPGSPNVSIAASAYMQWRYIIEGDKEVKVWFKFSEYCCSFFFNGFFIRFFCENFQTPSDPGKTSRSPGPGRCDTSRSVPLQWSAPCRARSRLCPWQSAWLGQPAPYLEDHPT